ncbi:GHKL domain-containing protein [Phormidium sp. LEGE 05292]|uniref:two-component system sensor histidine kinase RppB n=1 Tax=[Phormidium] sp. LEGE 05292 TaxID=767427 RepID=UPI00187F8057|nr:two-component system sensor histidine kinase RppB [Phormidium sp. LEGE 05292]MBE9229254.1 GHKL domain-containing protein [Phormidium sp. LEGE 05292]
MHQNRLFRRTRLQLAGWYAGVMGCILGLCGFGLYQVIAHAYWETIDQGLESVADAIDQSIEPVLQQPGQLQKLAQQLSLELCQTQANCFTQGTLVKRRISGAVAPVSFYLRLSKLSNTPIAIAGLPLDQLPLTPGSPRWLTLKTASGEQFRQISLPLQSKNQQWGYLQIGRSLADLDQHLTALRLTLLLGCPVALILVGLSSWWLAGLAMQPIYRSYQQIQQFTSDAAHELRTPLTAMQSTIDATLLQVNSTQSSVLELTNTQLNKLKSQTLRLSQLVKDLLLLTRLERQEPPQQIFCCLNDLISDLIEELAFMAIANQVTLTAQFQVSEPLAVWGNEQQLYRLVSNLIDNAIQATPAGGKVIVLLNKSESYAIIQVQDTGVGIAPEDQRRIFDRFYRVQADRSRHTGGAGLGLAIVQAIVQAHQGSIHVQSQLGKGSTFTVRLLLEHK